MCLLSAMFPHELEALLDALRRDLRTEQAKSFGETADVNFHRQNVRKSLRLLETLNPREPHRHNYRPAQMVKSGRHDTSRRGDGELYGDKQNSINLQVMEQDIS